MQQGAIFYTAVVFYTLLNKSNINPNVRTPVEETSSQNCLNIHNIALPQPQFFHTQSTTEHNKCVATRTH